MTLAPLTGTDLDARSLRVIQTLSENRSLTAAAAALGYSQPAISQLLKRLELRLGMSVIERVGRSVRLTEAGRLLAGHARGVLSALDVAAGELAQLQGLRSGRVRLVAFPSASATLVPRLLARMNRRHPAITITYVEAEPPEALAAVREDAADLAITFSYPGDRADPQQDRAQGLRSTRLYSEEMYLVLPATHPLAERTAIELADLSNENWIGGCPRCRGHLLELCDTYRFVPRISYQTDNVAAVLGMVSSGIGVAMLPSMAIRPFGTTAGLVFRPTTDRDHRTVKVVSATAAEQVPALARTMEQLSQLAIAQSH